MKNSSFKLLTAFCFISTVQSQTSNEIDRIREETNLNVQREISRRINCRDYLWEIGPKLGLFFTLEYQGYRLTRKPPKIYSEIPYDLSITSTPSLLLKLRRDLPGLTVAQDAKNPRIVHIIEDVLSDRKDYALNQKTSLRYSGNLVPCVVLDINDKNLVRGEGLAVALSKKFEGVEDGYEDLGMQSTDCVTVINVSATNETVRSILTDCIPLDNYSTILWRAAMTEAGAKPKILIQFYGPKR